MARGSRYVCVFAVVYSLGTSGCLPLPIPHMQQVTPRVSGRVRNSVGKPSSALQLALTAHDKDTMCTRPSVRTVTDSMGAFRVPFIEEDLLAHPLGKPGKSEDLLAVRQR
jgi:hypothetical protein